jgi:hypothetical protein
VASVNALIARALRVLSCCAVFAATWNLALADGWIVPAMATGLAIALAAVAHWVRQPDPPAADPAGTPEPEDAQPAPQPQPQRTHS